MVYIVDKGKINEDKGYILLGCFCGYRFVWRFVWRGILSDISEGNAENLGGDKE